jgi:hypothetical protein
MYGNACRAAAKKGSLNSRKKLIKKVEDPSGEKVARE